MNGTEWYITVNTIFTYSFTIYWIVLSKPIAYGLNYKIPSKKRTQKDVNNQSQPNVMCFSVNFMEGKLLTTQPTCSAAWHFNVWLTTFLSHIRDDIMMRFNESSGSGSWFMYNNTRWWVRIWKKKHNTPQSRPSEQEQIYALLSCQWTGGYELQMLAMFHFLKQICIYLYPCCPAKVCN